MAEALLDWKELLMEKDFNWSRIPDYLAPFQKKWSALYPEIEALPRTYKSV